MMEWVALIPTRHNIVRIRFKGGSLSGYGVTPATYTTRNPVVMRLIEESAWFRSGKIRLISKETTDKEESTDRPDRPDCQGQGTVFKKVRK